MMVFHRDSPFLRPAIASVLAQTLRDFELILVDNGTGLAPEALGEAGQDPRIRWVRLPTNEGIARGHNAGVQAAQSELIALMDYDDLSPPDRLEREVAALQADPGLGLVSGLAERIDEFSRPIGEEEFCLENPSEHRPYSQYAAPVITPAALARRSLLLALPYRPEFPFAADLDFQARAAEEARLAVLPSTLLRYRKYPGQTTQRQSASVEQSRCAIQILTARRRAGLAEDLAGVLAATAASSAGETCRRGARFSRDQRFFLVAAYQARRSLALERSPGSAALAFALASRIWRSAPAAERGQVARMFFSGPVKTLGLHPAGRAGPDS